MVNKVLLKIIGKGFQKYYSEIKSITNREESLMFQENYLKDLLLRAYRNVPYYHDIFQEIGIIKNNKVDLSKFGEIPILTKDTMRQQHETLISKDYKTRKWYYNSSGGSTGEPIRFVQDDLYDRWGDATFHYSHKDILGIGELIVKKVILWGSERDLLRGSIGLKAKIRNWLTNTIFLNSFRMTEQDIRRYIQIINSYKPDLIRGYASSLYELCGYAERKGMKVYTPKAIVSAADTLSDEMREKIENVFGTKVYNFYGSREISNMAAECQEGLMHVLAFHNYVEILNSRGRLAKEGEEGRVIVTNLHNYSMPFIRYDIGDMAVLGPKECGCGNPLPTLKKITGRITEHLVREDGAIISGTALTLTFNLKDWVKKFQIIQESYTKVRILIVLQDNVNESDKKEIEDKVKFLLDEDCQIIWEFVDEIPKTSQGKYLYIKSLVRR